ncbi:RagB/SusD family nutrient uptake outer membrane protein [Pedobacter nyackensis]|uniref:RagB/SusD family nutrient uptake outer membrane protein n=1 Tax=Pedobacter nyackensis TaxID=475255 RepID=UPI00292ECE57|nr:RagB/SusD family nutrient uptake outer membrane protein [Pedobacter nyackensis]
MKAYKRYLCRSLFLLLLFSQVACKKSFLEIDPKGKLVAKTTNDYNLMLNNPYFNITGVDGQLFLGDEVTVVNPFFSNMLEIKGKKYFQYLDDIYEPIEDGSEITNLTRQLYTYNVIINEVMNSEGGTMQDKLSYKAEALVNRSWIHFMLINYYGKPYYEATAANDPGFPILDKSDVTQNKFERVSVKGVYDFIITDLQTAIPALPISGGNRTRVCKAAAEALLAKVYLFMGKYPEGLVQINNSFNHLPTAYPVNLYDYNVVLAPGGAWGYNVVTSPLTFLLGESNITNNPEVIFAKLLPNSYTSFASDLLLSKRAYDLYSSGDQRLKFYSRFAYGGVPIKTPDVYRKLGPYGTQLGITLPEMYLMQAELKARTGDVTGAKTDLETFRAKRMSANVSVNITDPNAMVKFVIDERLREFALHGYRWFDIRRLSVDPIFSGTAYTHEVLSETGTIIGSFPLKPERFTLRIPKKILLANPGMDDNP